MKTKEYLINTFLSLVVAVLGVLLTNYFTTSRDVENTKFNDVKQSQRDVAGDVKSIGARLENASQRISSLEGQVSVLRQMIFNSDSGEATAFVTPAQIESVNALFPKDKYLVSISNGERVPASAQVRYQVPPGLVRVRVSQKINK
jgi:hypothetical protein